MLLNRVIFKPWGSEEIIELNDQYCLKCIYVNAGHRLSLQYHRKKIETMVFIKGVGNFHLNGLVYPIEPYFCMTILPGEVHRVEAHTDVLFYEVSTPELDDVVRLEDDYDRIDKEEI